MSGVTKKSVSTKTIIRNGVKTTIVETTITKPDGTVEVTTEESSEEASGDAASMMEKMKLGKDQAPKEAPKEVSLEDFRAQALESHNKLRSKHGVAPLTYADDLNKFAQMWAQKMADTGNFAHSKKSDRGGEGSQGENIFNKWSMPPQDVRGDTATEDWYSEINKPHDFTKDHQPGTGHFTQVVWAASKELGMGKALDGKGNVYVCGSYRPAGNLIGSFTANVFPKKD